MEAQPSRARVLRSEAFGDELCPQPTGGTKFGADERAIYLATLEQYPKLRATRIHEMIVARGYDGSVGQTRRLVRRLRPRPVAFKAAIARNLEEKIWPLIAEGRIKPVIHQTFPLAEAAEAHRLMESSVHIGKIMLVP